MSHFNEENLDLSGNINWNSKSLKFFEKANATKNVFKKESLKIIN
jgi:hypothetical protein